MSFLRESSLQPGADPRTRSDVETTVPEMEVQRSPSLQSDEPLNEHPAADQFPLADASGERTPSHQEPDATHGGSHRPRRPFVRFQLDGGLPEGGHDTENTDFSEEVTPRSVSVRVQDDNLRWRRFSYVSPDSVRPVTATLHPGDRQSQIMEKGDHPSMSKAEEPELGEPEASTLVNGRESDGGLVQPLRDDTLRSDHKVALLVNGHGGDSRETLTSPATQSAAGAAGNNALVRTWPGYMRVYARQPDPPGLRMIEPVDEADDAIEVYKLAKKHADICDYNLESFRRSVLKKELLCLANIKFRYGSRSSSRFVSIVDQIMAHLYPTPRQQKRLLKDTKRLLEDWETLLKRFELVEGVSRALYDEAREASTVQAAQSASTSPSRESQVELPLPRTTKALIDGALAHLDEVRVQEAVLGRRGEALDAQWDLLLAQLKQLDQVDLLKKRKKAYDPGYGRM